MRHELLRGEWDLEKNNFIEFDSISRGSNVKFWWICFLKHSWQASPNSRFNRKQTDCPFCSNQKVLPGFNDLMTRYPDVANQWDFNANQGLSPSNFAFGSGAKVQWRCSEEHTWSAPIFKRTINGSGCPVCSNRLVLKGFNDLQSRFPTIAAEFDSVQNGNLSPDQVLFSSQKRVFWKCEFEHTWITSVYHRTQSGTKCPVCTNRVILPGFNDLGTIHPELVEFWDERRNHPRKIEEFSSRSGVKVWWLCSFGHSHEQPIYAKVTGLGCPICSNHETQTGINDLAITHPELALEWHPTKNAPFKPENTVSGSHKRIWWLCAEGHEWQAQPANRASGTGCPSCAVSGFKLDRPSVLYFIVNERLMSRKVGITNLSTDRLDRFEQRGWREIKLWKFDEGSVPNKVETEFFRWLRKDLKIYTNLQAKDTKGTGGWTEAFSVDYVNDDEVIAKLEDLIEENSN